MDGFRLHRRKLNKTFLSVLFFAAIVVVFFLAVGLTQKSSLSGEEKALKSALKRAITHCYAENGYYPPSLDYIEEHYGLLYDPEAFFIDYRPVGGNIFPDYTVVPLGGAYAK